MAGTAIEAICPVAQIPRRSELHAENLYITIESNGVRFSSWMIN
jgi:hypothetical protein